MCEILQECWKVLNKRADREIKKEKNIMRKNVLAQKKLREREKKTMGA